MVDKQVRGRLRGDPATALRALADLDLNYDPAAAGGRGWHHDRFRHRLGPEPPGPPIPDGPFERACRLVRDYEAPSPSILRGYFHRDTPLEGRDMLLVGRFFGLRFPMGVRIDAVVDETREGETGHRERVWGWSYRTLEHHLERGRMVYEVIKDLEDGRVDVLLTGVSQRAPIANPIVRAGFGVFGRWTQRRFYRAAGRRLAALVADEPDGSWSPPQPTPVGVGDVVTAPTPRQGGVVPGGGRVVGAS